jgi:uncharacterized protein YjbI with pentapeptide repeats
MPSSIQQFRKSQEKSPKQTSSPSRFSPSISSSYPDKLLSVLMMLGVVNATKVQEQEDRLEESEKKAHRILDNPQNLTLTARESKEKIPYAVDPKQMPERPLRLATGLALRSLPEILHRPSPEAEYSKDEIAKAGSDLAMISRFNSSSIVESIREFEDELLESALIGLNAKAGDSNASLRMDEVAEIKIDELVKYIKEKRDSGERISLIGTKFENAKLVGEDISYGIFADLSDAPNIKSKYPFYETSPMYGKTNIFKVIKGVDFSGVDFRSANIKIDGIRFEDCNFQDAVMPSSQSVELIRSNLRGTDWSDTSQVNLKIGRGAAEESIAFQIMFLNEFSSYLEPTEIIEEFSKKVEPFLVEGPIIDVSGANFKGCELTSPTFFRANFTGADFGDKSKIINSKIFPVIIKDCSGLDLEKTSYEIHDGDSDTTNIKKFSGLIKLDLDKLKEQCAKIYGKEKADRLFTEFSTDGYVPKELLEKLRENKKIVVKININPDSLSRLISVDKLNLLLDEEERRNISKNAIKFLSKLFGQYNFEFVDQDYQRKADYSIDIGISNGERGVSYGEISRGNTTIIFGGKSLDEKFKPNYQTMAHELLHSLMGFTTLGYHTHSFEPAREIGMSNLFCGTLTYKQSIDLVVGDQYFKVQYNDYYSERGDDFVTSCVFDQNEQFLKFLGREKIDVPHADIVRKITMQNLGNELFFQQFPERENRVEIDEEFSKSYDISVAKAKDVVKYCRLSSINLCIENHNLKDDEMVIFFKPKITSKIGEKLPEPKIIYMSGGQKEIKLGNKILYTDLLKQQDHEDSVEVVQSISANKNSSQIEPQTTKKIINDSPSLKEINKDRLEFLGLLSLLAVPAVAYAYWRYGNQNRVHPQLDLERGGSPAPTPARGEIVFAGQPPQERPQRDTV